MSVVSRSSASTGLMAASPPVLQSATPGVQHSNTSDCCETKNDSKDTYRQRTGCSGLDMLAID